MVYYPFKSLIGTLIVHWDLPAEVIQLVQLLLCVLNLNPRVIHGVDSLVDEFDKCIKFVEGHTMRVSLWLLRVKCRLETLVILDDTVDVVRLVHGGHTDGERHFNCYSLQIFKDQKNRLPPLNLQLKFFYILSFVQ